MSINTVENQISKWKTHWHTRHLSVSATTIAEDSCSLLVQGPFVGYGALSCSCSNRFCLRHLGSSPIFIRLSDSVTVWWNLFFIQCKRAWSGFKSLMQRCCWKICVMEGWGVVWRLLKTIIAPEGSSYCVRHAEEEVSFVFIVVKSMPVPRVSCMPERQADSERSFNIDARLQTEWVTHCTERTFSG